MTSPFCALAAALNTPLACRPAGTSSGQGTNPEWWVHTPHISWRGVCMRARVTTGCPQLRATGLAQNVHPDTSKAGRGICTASSNQHPRIWSTIWLMLMTYFFLREKKKSKFPTTLLLQAEMWHWSSGAVKATPCTRDTGLLRFIPLVGSARGARMR